MLKRLILSLFLVSSVVIASVGCGEATKKAEGSKDTQPALKERPAPTFDGGGDKQKKTSSGAVSQ
jgi:hypothetical protein